MNELRKAAEMALEAIELHVGMYPHMDKGFMVDAREALRQALEQQDMGIDRGAWSDVPDATKWVDALRGDEESEQEPEAWTLTEFLDKRETTTNAPLWFVDPVNSAWTPLYTAPPSKPWGSLSDEDIWKDDVIMAANSVYGANFETLRELVKAIEAKLKEKNHG